MHNMLGAEALIRWNHSNMGLLCQVQNICFEDAGLYTGWITTYGEEAATA